MKSDYALRAMLELASAFGNGHLQTGEIASRRAIPESYLEQLLTALRRAGLVSSVRGPQGGHSLARHPSRITAGEVVRAMEGPVVLLERGGGAGGEDLTPSLLRLWLEVGAAIDTVLDGVTIEELAARDLERTGVANFVI